MTPAADFASDARRWQALVERDVRPDGTFVYGVTTTGIYCRPTCPSRKPNHKTARNESVERISRARTMIEKAGHAPSLQELADATGLSPYHFHRLFKKTVGITPKQYAMELRLQRMRKNIMKNRMITESVYESGYESNSRFYETTNKTWG